MKFTLRPPPKYGKAAQDLPPKDDSPLLDEKGKKRIQQEVGSFLYYAALLIRQFCAV